MHVLVTGGNGFLGRYIVKHLLERGYEVRVLCRGSSPLKMPQVECFVGDIADPEAVSAAVKGMDGVFHVAAKAGVWGSWAAYYAPNVMGTRNVIKACNQWGVKKLIYTSTPSVVFNGNAIQGGNETLPYGKHWLCAYAHTKALAEKEVLMANNFEGLRTLAIRPHLIWGIGDNHLIPRLLESAQEGKLCQIGNGKNRVDITHVENAAYAHLLAWDALEKGIGCGKAYFISQGEPVVLWEWIRALLKRLKAPSIQHSVPYPLAYAAAGLLEAFGCVTKKEPFLTRFTVLELAKDHYFDISAARRDLNYEPQVSTGEGLSQLVAYLRR